EPRGAVLRDAAVAERLRDGAVEVLELAARERADVRLRDLDRRHAHVVAGELAVRDRRVGVEEGYEVFEVAALEVPADRVDGLRAVDLGPDAAADGPEELGGGEAVLAAVDDLGFEEPRQAARLEEPGEHADLGAADALDGAGRLDPAEDVRLEEPFR